VTEQSYDYEIKAQDNEYALMQHSFLKTYFAVKQKGPFVYGVEKATDEETITQILVKFTTVLPHEE
jgi:hypothetical protein